jgi:hypothetical protein
MTAIWNADNPFYSASSRLARGYEHISQLERQIRSFLAKKPYELARDVDPADGRYQRLKFKFSDRLPDSATFLATEALEALRFALDQTGYAAAVASGKNNPRKTQFPISDSPEELDNLINGRKVCRDVPEPVVQLFRSFEPYQGSHSTFWALNKLRNSGHKKLIPVAIGGALITLYDNTGPDNVIMPVSPLYDSTENEIVFARAPIGQKLRYNVRPAFNVCFEQTEVAGEEYVFGFLSRSAREVEYLIVSTEEECRRLGLVS